MWRSGRTLLWLPLSIAAVGRAAFVKYRFTDRRLSSITTAPWKTEQLDAAYEDVVDVKSIGRGVGYWGDMVVTLRNGDKVERCGRCPSSGSFSSTFWIGGMR